MERVLLAPRKNWQSHVEKLGFGFHSIDDMVYWNEGISYHFSPSEIEVLEKATNEIHAMCMKLVSDIIDNQRYHELNIPEFAWPVIELSWKTLQKTNIGRLDICYDGINPPKLLEYNGDTPVCLLEASLVQKQWLETVLPHCGQFNSLHERLVESWRQCHFENCHLACRMEYPEMLDNINYLAKTMQEAGIKTQLTHIDKIKWDGEHFIDENKQAIDKLFKLFPWEWMIEEVFSRVMHSQIYIIEPAWKMILNNKGMMVLLWEMFPGHPNLLPTYFDTKKIMSDYVAKTIYGRGSDGVVLHHYNHKKSAPHSVEYGQQVYQQVHLPAKIDDRYTVIGSWIIDGQSAGIGIREDITPILHRNSHFVPHFVD